MARRAAKILVAAVTLPLLLILGVGWSPAWAGGSIAGPGPLTDITISDDLNCSVNYAGDSSGEWYGDTACGTLLAVGGTLYGPASIPAGGAASPRTPWTTTSSTPTSGSGTALDPYKVVTRVVAGDSGVSVVQTDTYVVGDESYRTDIAVTNNGADTVSASSTAAGTATCRTVTTATAPTTLAAGR
jgi:hypothetical protein